MPGIWDSILGPSTIPGKRFRGHPEHHIYLKEMKNIEEHPSVSSHHFDEPMGTQINETIENYDGNITVPISNVTVNQPSELMGNTMEIVASDEYPDFRHLRGHQHSVD